MTDDDRQPPQDLAAERAVLGAMLWSADAIADVVDMLGDGDVFYRPAHQVIYTAIVALHRDGIAADPVSVGDLLLQRGQFERAGGTQAIDGLYSGVATATNAEHYARIISGKAALRKVAAMAPRLHQLAHSGVGSEDLDEALDQARKWVDDATAGYRNRSNDEGADAADLAAAALERYAEPVAPGLPSGWHDLDRMLSGGLKPGNFCLVAARPAVGKSVMGINWVTHVARAGTGALFASMEMHRDEVMDRILADLATVELDHLTRHELTDQDWERVRFWAMQLRDVPLRIEDTPYLSLARLRSLARDRTRASGGLGLVAADYVQLMRPADSKVQRQEQVAELSRGLKLLGKELHVPVVGMSQLNREVEKRSSPRPVLADLRESGALEQDPDVVLLLWDDPDRPGERQVVVAKNRQGPVGDVSLKWSPNYARMRSLAPPPAPLRAV